MANIGEINTRVNVVGAKKATADLRGVAAGTTQLSRAAGVMAKETAKVIPPQKALTQQLSRYRAAAEAGVLSTKRLRIEEQKLRAESHALFRAQQPMGKELVAFNRIQRDTARFSLRSRQGLGTLRSTMASLGARMVGVNGTVGTFLGAIGQFAVGNLVSLGIIGGITALVFAMKRLGDTADKSKDKFEELFNAVEKASQTELGSVAERRELATQRLKELTSQIAILQSPQAAGALGAERVKDLLVELEKVQFVFKELAKEESKILEKRRLAREELAKSAELIKQMADDMERMGKVEISKEFKDLVGALTGQEFVRKKLAGERPGSENEPLATFPQLGEAARRVGAFGIKLPGEELLDALGESRDTAVENVAKIRKAWEDAMEAQGGFERVGEVAARTFVRGFLDAITTSGNLFKKLRGLFVSVFKSALTEAILSATSGGGGIFGKLFGAVTGAVAGLPAGPAGVAAGAAAGSGAIPLPGQSASPSLSISIRPPTSPEAMRRDSAWLEDLSEGLLNLEAGGFRLAGA